MAPKIQEDSGLVKSTQHLRLNQPVQIQLIWMKMRRKWLDNSILQFLVLHRIKLLVEDFYFGTKVCENISHLIQ